LNLPRLDLFPLNGLDRSLHAPVLVGLLVLTLFTETLGWTYAGLVVPGYLAAVFVTAPVTALLIIGEALLTYWIAALLGRWLPRTGAWSTTFGRERFFLFIVGAIVVRLAVEGNLVPFLVESYGISHSRELYSLGLVLVPLVSNMFWNAGLRVSAPRIFIVTVITYVVLEYFLLRHTNFTISRFEVANESVSLTFLESPHAHIILLVGAMLGARANVLYGWDYNGILVPALLAVAWYQPTKLLTTIVEALFVYWLSKLITTVGPLSKLLIVGSRRMVVAYTVGFVVKLGLGYGTMYWDRSIQMVDYFGFGYLLPSLLAVKMWNKAKVGVVVMPTVQVSLLAFVVGNAVGIGLNALSGNVRYAHAASKVELTPRDAATSLLLGDTQPSPHVPDAGSPRELAARAALRVAQQARDGHVSDRVLDDAVAAGLELSRDPKDSEAWLAIAPRSEDPDDDRMAPRLAVRAGGEGTTAWLVIAATERVGSPAIPVALRVARRLGARAVVLHSHLAAVRPSDEAFAEQLASTLALAPALIVSVGGPTPTLSVVGSVPQGLDVVGLGEAFGVTLRVVFRAPTPSGFRLGDSPRLELPQQIAEQLAAAELSPPPIDHWPDSLPIELTRRVHELTTVGRAYGAPTIEELRLFGAAVVPQLTSSGQRPSDWARALAGRLNYRFVSVGNSPTAPDAWGLVEPAGPDRRGNASWFVRAAQQASSTAGGIAIEVPAPRWEAGTTAAGTSLYGSLPAEMLLISGALPNDPPPSATDPRNRGAVRSFYQRIHERWLDGGGHAVSISGIAPTRAAPSDAVLSYGNELPSLAARPEWSRPIGDLLERAGLTVTTFDGSLDTAPFSGSTDPTLAYALRFAPEQMVLLWLGADVRAQLVRAQEDHATLPRIERAGHRMRADEVVPRLLALAQCSNPDSSASLSAVPDRDPSCARAKLSSCDLDEVTRTFDHYARTRNPYDLERALSSDRGCAVELVEDRATGRVWALAAAKGRVRAVPLLGGQVRPLDEPLRDATQIRYTSALGLSSFTVESP
jgi:hypothetical protein